MDILAPYRARIVISRLCRVLITLGLGLAWSMLWAQTRVDNNVATNGSVIGNSVLYSIGGCRAVFMNHAGNKPNLCGCISLDHQLNFGKLNLKNTVEEPVDRLVPANQFDVSNLDSNG